MNWFADPKVLHLFTPQIGKSIQAIDLSSDDVIGASSGKFTFMSTLEVFDFLQNSQSRLEPLEATLVVITDALPPVISIYAQILFQKFNSLYIIFGDETVGHFQKQELLLSIVIPIYNVEAQIPDLLASLTPLSEVPVEIIFVDDGSTDESGRLTQDWTIAKPLARYIRKKNGGCASARNTGLSMAQGKYVMFVDGDDMVDPVGVTSSLVHLTSFAPDVAVGNYSTFTESAGSVLGAKSFEFVNQRPQFIDSRYLVNQQPTIWRCFYRKEFLEALNLKFLEVGRYDDLPFWFQSTISTRNVLLLKENLYYWRLDRIGQSMGVRDERLNVHFEIFSHLDEWVEQFSREYMRALWQTKIDTHLWAIRKIDKKYRSRYLKSTKRDLFESKTSLNAIEFIWGVKTVYARRGIWESLWIIRLRFLIFGSN